MADKQQRPYATCGLVMVSNPSKQSAPRPAINNYEVTTKGNYYDKPSGSYARETVKQSYSSGEYSNRGRAGHKDEFKASSTVRVGHPGGYTEYTQQQKVTRVQYNNNYNNCYYDYNNYGGHNDRYLN